MTSVDIKACAHKSWLTVCEKVNRASIFIDSACAESLHWHGGAMLLFQSGAKHVKELSSFESGYQDEQKAVFIISGLLSGLNIEILRDIIQASSFQYVIVISSLLPAMHTLVELGATEEETAAFNQLEDQLLEWMGDTNYTTEVLYLPLSVSAITPDLFVLPDQSDVFPLLPSDIKQLQHLHKKDHGQDIQDLEYTNLPREKQLQAKLLVCSLNGMLEQLGVSEDCYALGVTSKMVASELASLTWARTRRKSSVNKASLLLVDRTLDVASVVGHHSESLLDRILSVLPRLPGHHNDVQVNMVPICSVPECAVDVIVPGCLGHFSDIAAWNLLSTLASKKQKECLMEVNRQLVEAAAACNLPIKLTGRPGRITPEQMQSTINLFKGKNTAIRKHLGLLQISQGVVDALKDPSMSEHDSLLGVEKGFIQNLDDESCPSPLFQITQMLNKKPLAHSFEDVFILLLYIYSVIDYDDVDIEEEKILQATLLDVILDEDLDSLPEFLQSIAGSTKSHDKSHDKMSKVLDEVFRKLQGLATARNHLRNFRSVHGNGDMTAPTSLKPLLKQVIQEIFDPSKPELPDIIYKSTGFRDLIKSGFGLFMNVSKPRPNDHPLLIVFVIGGVTNHEVRQIKEAVAATKSTTQVIVGSTNIIKPQDVLHRVFVQNNMYPETVDI